MKREGDSVCVCVFECVCVCECMRIRACVHNSRKMRKKKERNVMGGHFSDKNNLSMDPVKEK